MIFHNGWLFSESVNDKSKILFPATISNKTNNDEESKKILLSDEIKLAYLSIHLMS